MKTKYDVLVRNGKERFVVIPEKDYQALRDRLEDEADFRDIEDSKRRQAGDRTISHAEMKRRLGMTTSRKRKAG